MACTEWQEMLIDHLAGELSEDDVVLLEQHLAACRACRREAAALSRMGEAARSHATRPVDPGLEARLVNELRRRHTADPLPSAAAHPFNLLRTLWASVRQPLPSQAMAIIAGICLMTGFWFGRLQPDVARVPTGGEQAVLTMPSARTAGEDSLAACAAGVVESTFAFVSDGMEILLRGPEFVATYADAISFPGAVWRDSL